MRQTRPCRLGSPPPSGPVAQIRSSTLHGVDLEVRTAEAVATAAVAEAAAVVLAAAVEEAEYLPLQAGGSP